MYSYLHEKIRHLDYVVQRNWELLPEVPPEHPDLDLFVSEKDRDELIEITKSWPDVDVRSASDNYYPAEISKLLLLGKREYRGWLIPSLEASFIALYYHDAIHKQENPYHNQLRQMFLEMFPAVKCTDEGVGYYAPN